MSEAPTRKFSPAFRFLLLLALFVSIPVSADDKNGVTPNTISLPSGPGSIEGFGESFQPQLNTGSARYAVGIDLPDGIAGHNPALSLRYESGNGDGPLGIGWRFDPGRIARQTDKGIPRYVDGPNGVDDDHDGIVDEADEIDTFLGVEGEELVQLADGSFRARIEGTFIRYRRVNDYWTGEMPNGTRLVFGSTRNARIDDPGGQRIFAWLLESSTDKNGNVIEYSYRDYPNSRGQKYLSEVRYGPGQAPWPVYYFARFTYQDRPDWRKDYRSGFLVRKGKRLTRIDIGIQGAQPPQCAPGDWNQDNIADALIRRYDLEYDDSTPGHSFLASITQFGSDGVSYLPPLRFSYSSANPIGPVSAASAIIGSSNTPITVMDSDLAELVDLNRDGLPDLLKTDLWGGSQLCFFNDGETDSGSGPEIRWEDGTPVDSSDGLASRLHLQDKLVHLADMDGDGLSDLVHTTATREVFYFQNQGDGSWADRRPMSILDTAPPAPFSDDHITTADFNFDKRIDVAMSTNQGFRFWFNITDGQYSEEVRTTGATYLGQVIDLSASGVEIADINGDRLVDVAWIRPTHVIYNASMGYGNFDTAIEIAIPDAVLSTGTNSQISRAKLKDIDGDGLADLVIERAQANELWFWRNQGTDTFASRIVVSDMPTLFGSNFVTRWADMNGNGTTDLVYADSAATPRLRTIDLGTLIFGSAHPNLLTAIENGLGVTTSIRYRSSSVFAQSDREAGKPWNTNIPFPVQVVAEVRTSTGLDLDQVPGLDEYRKTYRYRDGYYEDRERAFRGFSEVTVTEHGDSTSPSRVSRHGFYSGGPDGEDNDGDGKVDEVSAELHREDDALKGQIRFLETLDDQGLLFSAVRNDWQIKNLDVAPSGIEIRFAEKIQSDTLVHEGNPTPEILRMSFVYDLFGNVIEEKNQGALSINGDEVFTTSEFINDTGLWLLGLPKRVVVSDANGQKASETISYYDGPDYSGLALGLVSRGNLTRQEAWTDTGVYVDALRNAYDGFGNVVGTLDPNGNRRSIVYDNDLHRFPVEERIEVGGGNPDLTINAVYNIGLGVLTRGTDFNANPSDFEYDLFGRLTAIVRPGDSTLLPTLEFAYTMADPSAEVVYAYDRQGNLTLSTGVRLPSSIQTRAREISGQAGTFDRLQYVDGLGRKLAVVEEDEQGFVVQESVSFNALGIPHLTFLPYAVPASSYSPPDPNSLAVAIRYDAAGREIQRINPPDKNGQTSSTATAYQPLHRTETDENNVDKDFVQDGLERLVEVHEHNGSEIYVTRYEYDPLGNPTKITDSQNNWKSMLYDGLSRKIQLDDPDRGTMLYVYDDAGNLVQSVDNKQQTVIYTYDGANRLLSEDYLDSALFTPDIAYHYDAPSADYPGMTNCKGKLAWVEDLSGASFWSYDARGNAIRSVKRIKDAGSVQDFHSRTDYDAMDRMFAISFPDGDRVEYRYDRRSKLKEIPGLVNGISYRPSGQMDEIIYANGRNTRYTYDPRQRLIGLATDRTTPSGNPIQDLSYDYDGVGNILGIVDHRSQLPDPAANASQTFQYDELYRLMQAAGPGYGRIDFQYDQIGNITFKSSPLSPDPEHINDSLVNLGMITSGGGAGSTGRGPKLPSDPPGPHAVTATASGLQYDYDDNGNMTSHAAGDLYEWDFRDRLVKTTTATTVAEYVYDFSGQRVIKKSQTGAAKRVDYYVGKGFEVRDGKPVKFIFSDSRRLARIEGRLTAPGQTASQTLHFDSGWNFFSLDVEPADPAVDTVLAPLAGNYSQIWEFDPINQQYRGYEPLGNLTDLSEVRAQRGYIIHLSTPATLEISGTRLTDPVDLQSGFNLISPPTDAPTPVQTALAALSGNYSGVWNYESLSENWQGHLPGQPVFLNTLNELRPGKAYWVNVANPAQLAYQPQPRKILFYHLDHLGSSNVVTDLSGNVVESTEFYPFGLPRSEYTNGLRAEYGFTGKERDSESGLMYFEARYYDGVVGKFVSVDPIGEEGGLNQYAYANNNPVIFYDPDGNKVDITSEAFWKEAAKGVAYGVVGAAAVTGLVAAATVATPILAGAAAVTAVGFAAVGGYYTGAATYETLTGESHSSGKVLTDEQHSAVAGQLVGALIAGGATAKFLNKFINKVGPTATNGVRYGPANPGPLNNTVAATFRGGSYTATTVSETTTLYRAYGGSAGKLGSYWTRTKPSGPLQSQLDSALAPQWGNTAQNVISIRVPKGTTIYEGAAAQQSTGVGQIPGGGNQVYIPRVDPKWIR